MNNPVELSIEDRKVLDLWDAKCEIVDQHFQLPIPWKAPEEQMPDNFKVARNRVESLYKSLKMKSMIETYDKQIDDMVLEGYVESVDPESQQSPAKCWYLPTHAVLKRDKHSIRIVFDCAHTYNGISLNGSCYQGPNLTSKLYDVLLRFRQHHSAVMADIAAMYNQVKIPIHDRDALRFLWIRDGHIQHFRSTSHLFGGIWCSSSASYALRRSAETTSDLNIQNIIMQSFYVDDLAYSSADPTLLNAHIVKLKHVLNIRGFNLRKFIATDPTLLDGIEQIDRVATQATLEETSVLGIGWRVEDDVLSIKISMKSIENKSQLLSVLASIYDPLGLITPLLVHGKLLFQEAVKHNISWQAQLPQELRRRCQKWAHDMTDVPAFVIPRCLIPKAFDDASFELHCFNAASQQAYGCCIYLRCTSKSGSIHTSLITSKQRVCPIKGQTIPRLELQSAVLSARLEESVRTALTIPLLDSTFWTDSKIVLAYIQNESRRFSLFVTNRVLKIKRSTSSESWRHIAGILNPADILTRPVTVHNININIWLKGPVFLRTYRSEWHDDTIPDASILHDDKELLVPK